MKRSLARSAGRSTASLLLLFAALNPQSSMAQAAPGALDPTFAGSGMSRLSFGGDFEECRATVVQSDGKLLLAGAGDFGSGSEFELVRLGTNYQRDLSFGTAGVVLTPFFDEPTFANASAAAVAVQADARIVVAGAASYDNGGSQYTDFALARYNPDGSLDNTFGSGGKVITDFGGSAVSSALVIQSDGKLVVAGRSGTSFALARYQTNGLLDTTFGTGGTVATYAGGSSGTDGAAGLLLQPDGKLIAVGTGNGGNSFAILRYTTSGVLDTTFGSGGVVYTTIPGALSSYATCAAYERSFSIFNPDKFVVAGDAYNNSWHVLAVARYNLDGSSDTTFGTGGIVTNVFAAGASGAWCTAVLDVGVIGTGHKITVGGYGSSAGETYFGIARFLGSGAPDTTFGSGGSGMTALSFGAGRFDQANALTIQAGNYVLAGFSFADTNYNNGNAAAARFTSGGLLDTSFGNGGVVTFDLAGQSYAQAVAVQPDGRIVAAGGAWAGPTSIGLARYNADGTPDVSFGSYGRVATPVGLGGSANALQLQPDGRIVSAGYYIYTNYSGSLNGFALARHNADGSLDTSFGSGGTVTTTFGTPFDYATGLALQSDGEIVVAGDTQVDSINHVYNIALARYSTNGLLDASFGGTGKIVTQVGGAESRAGGVLIQPDGNIVVGGFGQVSGNTNFALLRFLPTGSLDGSFGSFGRVTTDFGVGNASYGNALALQADGKIILAGRVTLGGVNNIALARYTPGGSLDPAFGTGGKVTTQVGIVSDYATSVALLPNGKILVAGPSQQGNKYKFAVLRYLPDGTLDGSYGVGGKVLVNFNDGSDVPSSLALDQIGRAVVAGEADTMFGIARLASEPVLQISSIISTNRQILLEGLGVPATNNSLLASPTAGVAGFGALAPVRPDAAGFWQYLDTDAAAFTSRFYRLSLP